MAKEVTGEVMIADDAVLCIAAIAATDIRGVRALKSGFTRDNIHLADTNALEKAVKINNGEEGVICRISIILDGTVPIPTVTEEVQEKIKLAIEMMTGKSVYEVNVDIAGVEL